MNTICFLIRKLVEHFVLFFYNHISIYYKRLKFSFWNVNYGKNMKVVGRLRLRMTQDASILIGDNFLAFSGFNSTIDSGHKNVLSAIGGGKDYHS